MARRRARKAEDRGHRIGKAEGYRVGQQLDAEGKRTGCDNKKEQRGQRHDRAEAIFTVNGNLVVIDPFGDRLHR